MTRLAPAVLALVLALVVGLPALAWAQDVVVPIPSGVGPSELGGGLGALAAIAIGIDKLVAMQKRRTEQADREKEDARLRGIVTEVLERAMIAHLRDDDATHRALDTRVALIGQRLDQIDARDKERREEEAERWRTIRGDIAGVRDLVARGLSNAP